MAGRVPAPLVFVASAFSQYLGAGLAVSLFSLMPSTSILVGAVVLGQLPSGWKVAGLVLVSVAVALAGADGRAGQGNGSQSAVEAHRSPPRAGAPSLCAPACLRTCQSTGETRMRLPSGSEIMKVRPKTSLWGSSTTVTPFAVHSL